MTVGFRRLAWVVLVVALLTQLCPPASAFGPGAKHDRARDEWMSGYLKVQEAADAAGEKRFSFALELYEEALAIFRGVQQQYPEWNTHVVSYRIKFCEGQIRRLQLEVEIDAEKMSRPDLIREVRHLRATRKGHQADVDGLNNRIAGLRQEMESLRKERSQLASETAQMAALRTERDGLKQQVTALDERLKAEAQEKALMAEQAARVPTLTRQTADLEAKVSEARQTSAGLRERLGSVETERNAAKTEAERLAADLADLRKERDALQRKTADLDSTATALRQRDDELAEARKERGRLTRRVAALDKAQAQLQTRATSLEESLAAKTAAVETRDAELTARAEQIKELERLVALAKAADVDKLHREARTSKAALAENQDELKDLRARLLRMEESERRLIDEQNRRIEEERKVRVAKRQREEKLHGFLTTAAAAELKGDNETALWNFKQVLEMEPGHPDALARVGIILAGLGNDGEAEQYLERAYAADPTNADVILRLGYVQLRQDKHVAAIGTLGRGIGLYPDRADYRRYMGISCSSMGWVEAAEWSLKEAFRLDGSSGETAYNLAVLYATLDRPNVNAAREWYKKALELGTKRDPGMEKFLAP